MQSFVHNGALQRRIKYLKGKGKIVGFSPTMGALHEGHLSLIEHSQKLCDISVCSIFVNPTQFNEKSDLDKYPRTLSSDKQLLLDLKLDILYAPTVDQIYPKGKETKLDLDLEGLDNQLEGAFRPGHFEGVMQVVKRLLDIVQPDMLFMGQKDFQQFTIIGHMIRKLGIPVELVVVPIKREADGLAMSSRNSRLTPHFRKRALVLSRMLKYAAETILTDDFETIKSTSIRQIESAGLIPEYFELVDGNSLLPVISVKDSDYIVALVAAWAGDVRLIDNAILVTRKN